jgi:hypothetical protein
MTSQKTEIDIATHIIKFLEETWQRQGVMDRGFSYVEEFSEKCAIEVALNELLDYATNKGYLVRTPAPDRQEIRDLVCD